MGKHLFGAQEERGQCFPPTPQGLWGPLESLTP